MSPTHVPNWFLSAVEFLSGGLLNHSGLTMVFVALVLTHITIASVTIYLHRHQAHRALELHPVASHFFRFWLWLTTGIVTAEWVGVHRKHHAKCETKEDPHSPRAHGLKKVLLEGSELYREEAANPETLKKFTNGTPADWIERHLYTKHSRLGVSLFLIANVLAFGAGGLAIWAVSMLWIPVNAAGIINGLGHWMGYRNFESDDGSTNLSPWGILIGGEELHNNHHTYPTSAKLSVKPFEFDIGWLYIRCLEVVGLARVKRIAQSIKFPELESELATLSVTTLRVENVQAVVLHRYEVMAQYAKAVRLVCTQELRRLESIGLRHSKEWRAMRVAKKWVSSSDIIVSPQIRAQLVLAIQQSAALAHLIQMRADLKQIWENSNAGADALVHDLKAWCESAQRSSVLPLQQFAKRLQHLSAHTATSMV